MPLFQEHGVAEVSQGLECELRASTADITMWLLRAAWRDGPISLFRRTRSENCHRSCDLIVLSFLSMHLGIIQLLCFKCSHFSLLVMKPTMLVSDNPRLTARRGFKDGNDIMATASLWFPPRGVSAVTSSFSASG
jgi:hypothetical protein